MTERIEEHWALLKAALLADGGHDRLVDFLADAHVFALLERGEAQSIDRTRRDRIRVITNDAAQ